MMRSSIVRNAGIIGMDDSMTLDWKRCNGLTKFDLSFYLSINRKANHRKRSRLKKHG
jgi:hypothetical protein